jgi:hypothetical protein
MPEKDRESIVSKATAMKKAGFHPVMIVVITVLSTPGIWQQFFDDTDEKALEAIQAAYPVLQADMERTKAEQRAQSEINLKLLSELKALKMLIAMTHDLPESEVEGMGIGSIEGIGIGVGGGSGSGGFGTGAGVALAAPGTLFSAAGDDEDAECEEGVSEAPVKSQPSSGLTAVIKEETLDEKALDEMIKEQRQMPRDKLPDLDDLLGGKK